MRGGGIMRAGVLARQLLCAVLLVAALVPGALAAVNGEAIRRALGNAEQLPALSGNTGAIREFYARRNFLPAWQSASGEMTPQALAIRAAVAASTSHGLDRGDYHSAGIASLWPTSQAAGGAQLDLLLTDALLRLARHLYQGRATPASVDPDWHIPPQELDSPRFLDSAPDSPDLGALLQGLAPPGTGYAQLRAALARYRKLAKGGEWRQVGPGPTLRPGDLDPRVAALRERLRAEGHFTAPAPADTPLLYDSSLESAVLRFQRLHSLAADGLVGPRTLAALDVPLAARIAEIRLNLERWRWLPRQWPQRRVLVNAAAFELRALQGDEVELSTRVIVGRPLRSTPTFVGAIRGITVNPFWNVPESIARRDIVPAQIRDPDYLRSRQIRVFENWSPGARELEPEQVDWEALRGKRFPHYLRQEPGPHNALGRIKFLSDNEFSIYLHDTPERQLFQRESRTFSSGCIRVQTAEDLALWLFEGVDGWNAGYLQTLIDSAETRNIRLPEPVPLYLVYFTTWVDAASGELYFAEDIYTRNKALAAQLATAELDPACSTGAGRTH